MIPFIPTSPLLRILNKSQQNSVLSTNSIQKQMEWKTKVRVLERQLLWSESRGLNDFTAKCLAVQMTIVGVWLWKGVDVWNDVVRQGRMNGKVMKCVDFWKYGKSLMMSWVVMEDRRDAVRFLVQLGEEMERMRNIWGVAVVANVLESRIVRRLLPESEFLEQNVQKLHIYCDNEVLIEKTRECVQTFVNSNKHYGIVCLPPLESFLDRIEMLNGDDDTQLPIHDPRLHQIIDLHDLLLNSQQVLPSKHTLFSLDQEMRENSNVGRVDLSAIHWLLTRQFRSFVELWKESLKVLEFDESEEIPEVVKEEKVYLRQYVERMLQTG